MGGTAGAGAAVMAEEAAGRVAGRTEGEVPGEDAGEEEWTAGEGGTSKRSSKAMASDTK